MLATIRSTVATWFVKILFGVLIASFAVWGIGDIFRGGYSAQTEVAEVGSVAISRQALDREFRREVDRVRQAFGGDLDLQQARSLGLLDRALNQLIVRALFGLEQDRLGMAVSETQVRAEIARQPTFKDSFGQFDRQQFDFVLRQLGLTEGDFVTLSRADIARQQLADAIAAGAKAPAALVEAVYAYREEARVADTVEIASATMTVEPPDEAAIQRYYDQNPDRFTAPEYRTVTYVTIEVDDIAKEINVSPEDIASAYQEREAEFTIAEQRSVEQIVLPDEATAERAKAMLDQGREFAVVAAEVAGQTDAAALSVGRLTRAEFPLPDAADTVFGLAAMGVTNPIASPLGWHIFRVTAIEPGRIVPLDEVRDRLTDEMARERALDVMFELANKLQDELAGGATLEEAAGRLALSVTSLADVDRTGALKDGSAASAAIVKSPEFLSSAFETSPGDESQLGETDAGSYFVLRVDAVTAPAVRPLPEVRETVVNLLTAERRKAAAEAAASEIVDAMKGGRTLESAAGERGLEIATSEPFTREGRTPGPRLPPAVVSELFAAAPGAVASGPTANGFMVARLKEIRTVDPSAAAAALEAVADSLDQAVRDDILAQFTSFLRGRHTVSISQDAIDSLFVQP
jgi:peptidyl-prolyl cis-trans isomerase D